MLFRAINRPRIRIEARKIIRKRDDVVCIAEGRMRRHDLHCRIDPRSRSEHRQLLFQIALLLAGKIRDGAIR